MFMLQMITMRNSPETHLLAAFFPLIKYKFDNELITNWGGGGDHSFPSRLMDVTPEAGEEIPKRLP